MLRPVALAPAKHSQVKIGGCSAAHGLTCSSGVLLLMMIDMNRALSKAYHIEAAFPDTSKQLHIGNACQPVVHLEQRAQAAPEAGLQHAICPQMVQENAGCPRVRQDVCIALHRALLSEGLSHAYKACRCALMQAECALATTSSS